MRGGPPRPATAVFMPLPISREITITEGITVKDLTEKLNIKAKDLMQRLINRGVFATINQTLDAQVATSVARDFGAEARVISFEEEALEAVQPEVGPEGGPEVGERVPCPPVVTIMGHVDHGKTSLLDVIRKTSVIEQEAGGITQHIGAYQVEINNRKITFIDTPGHEAFTRMRARGSKVTDIVVLVVAADDGVMPQTLEAMDHARAANVPMVVAINKVDKPEASPERVKRQLSDRGLMPEEWGGQTVTVEVSAKQKKNLDLLQEMILLVADLQELKASPSPSGDGHGSGSRAGPRPRPGGHGAGARWDPARGGPVHRRFRVRQGAGAVGRSGSRVGGSASGHPRGSAGAQQSAAGGRPAPGDPRSAQGQADSPLPRAESARGRPGPLLSPDPDPAPRADEGRRG